MIQTGNNMVSIYTEATPNPETMKFVANKLILHSYSVDFASIEEAKVSPLASDLFLFPFVKGVFISSNFVTITKTEDTDWYDIIPTMKEFLKTSLEANKPSVNLDYLESLNAQNSHSEPLSEEDLVIVEKIKDLLETYVKPAVEMDGGAIQFKNYKQGVVTVSLQGSCSGCPSSIITLKSGIEGMMKKMIPEVKEVIADND